MDDTILFPSPNWFQTTVLAVTSDNWLIYGGPSRGLCVCKPFNKPGEDGQGYQTHFINRAHGEKIVSVDISPEWPEKRCIVAGSGDGIVKQWSFTEINKSIKIKLEQSHDLHHKENEEVVGVGYINETFVLTIGSFGNLVKWDIASNVVKSYDKLLKNFKPTCMACSPHLPFNVAVGTKQGIIFVLDLNDKGKVLYKVRGQNEETLSVSWCPQYEVVLQKSLETSEAKSQLSDRLAKIRLDGTEEDKLNNSGLAKDLPDDSFEQSIVQEDDMFDIYKDHEEEEFGHKKYKPELIRVKIKEEKEENKDDFLSECLKLKEDLLKRKNEPEESIHSLVKKVDGDIEENFIEENLNTEKLHSDHKETSNQKVEEASTHIHKHLLASIGKAGSVRIWSKSGKLVSSCVISGHNKNIKLKAPMWATLLWYRCDVLLISNGRSELFRCNPLKLDSKNKLHWNVEHILHKRGLYAISTNAPRQQSKDQSEDKIEEKSDNGLKQEDWVVWTISQDRNMICHSVENKKCLGQYNSAGGYVYMIDPCPYDARQYAICVGDGAVRVWETDLDEDHNTLSSGTLRTYWQNVQGKVLTVAWHPTTEDLLAFSTGESRVGLINTSGKGEKPARLLVPAGRGGVYSISWGPGDKLYACGGGELVMYNTKNSNDDPIQIPVQVEGNKWNLCAVQYSSRGLLVGSIAGGIAILDREKHQMQTAAFIFSKMIHKMDWHPQQISSSSEDSPLQNLIAVSSLDKQNLIAILEYDDEGDSPKIVTWKMLAGHKAPVIQVAWNPHIDHYLLSSSDDSTVRVWDVVQGACTHIFGGHTQKSLAVGWSSFPQLANTALSGGADYSLRLWDIRDFSAESYEETKHEIVKEKKKKKAIKSEDKSEDTATEATERVKTHKKFLLPTIGRQIYPINASKLRKMAEKMLEMSVRDDEEEFQMDFLKLFGSTNDFNSVLDLEMEQHLEARRLESYMMLLVLRGDMSNMVQFASENDLLTPFLVSLAPCVSFKYWKDTMQLYLAQMDRLAAKGDHEKTVLPESYGGVVYRKAAVLLSLHDIKGAVNALVEGRLFLEAYVLAKTRHMDSIAEETLHKWAAFCRENGCLSISAFCQIILGDAYQASVLLSTINDEGYLMLSSELAKMAGQETFAEHVDDKLKKIHSNEKPSESLKSLPTRTELAVKETNGSETNDV
ncbi:unnamed protein product [Pieris brassicae]|uniref:Uncharacterized protein n=2 Tax=Pieris brassicae TaxID=7116 RepID=A0A9P0XHE1_PIEBR|nr:unnamed protein product [Pieris brassicae]